MRRILRLISALNDAGVDYVVVGGVAVVLHGHIRSTVDLDVTLDLSAGNVLRALDALRAEGLQPRLPVPAEQFADADIRRSWVEDRNLVAFTLIDPNDAFVEVDLLATSPIPYANLAADAVEIDLGGLPVRVASIRHLISMKRESGRPQDLADVQALSDLLHRDGQS